MKRPELRVVASGGGRSAPGAGQGSNASPVERPVGRPFACAGGRGRVRRGVSRGVPEHPGVPDPHELRADMAGRWRAYLRAAYGRPDDVALDHGVTLQCACNWWQGACAPSGVAVARAALGPDRALFADAMRRPAGWR